MVSRYSAVFAMVVLLIGGAWWSVCAQPDEELYVSRSLTEPGTFTNGAEGPACDIEGNLYAVNYQREGTIGKVTLGGEPSVFVELPGGSIGNGIRFNTDGLMLIADYVNHNILQVDMQTREISVYAHEPRMNQPNDIAIGANDILYASDPNWGESAGQIWRIDPDRTITLLETGLGTTNGIEVGADERTLYVNESVQRSVWAYDLSPQGEISNKRLLIKFLDFFGLDGMRCDVDGNLYITRHGKGTVAKVSPEGEVLLEVDMMGKLPSNIAFGGPDGRTCYVTLQDRRNIETFRVDRPGRSWMLYPERKALTERVVSTAITPTYALAGQSTSLEVLVVFDAPLEVTDSRPRMILDVSPLGLSSEIPFDHDGEGRYSVNSAVTPLQTGQYHLPIRMETAVGNRIAFLAVMLSVYPRADEVIYEDGLEDRWTVEVDRAESDLTSTAFIRSGSSSHAILLTPGIFPGSVKYMLNDPDGLDLFGYSYLEFYINGGETSGQDPQVGGKKLSEWGIAVKPDTWTRVSIPISELPLTGGRLTGITVSGAIKETFYIDDMKLVAEEPPTEEPLALEEPGEGVLPSTYTLSQNYPNPFNPETTIRYDLPSAGTVRLLLYNLAGQRIRTLLDVDHSAGIYAVTWDGTDDFGRPAASGVYLCRMIAGDYSAVRKLMLLH